MSSRRDQEEIEIFAIEDVFVEKMSHFELMVFQVVFFKGVDCRSERLEDFLLKL